MPLIEGQKTGLVHEPRRVFVRGSGRGVCGCGSKESRLAALFVGFRGSFCCLICCAHVSFVLSFWVGLFGSVRDYNTGLDSPHREPIAFV